MRISKRKIDFAKYGGRYRIWIKPYRTRMRTDLKHYNTDIEYTLMINGIIIQIPKFRIIERRGKLFIHSFIKE